MKKLILAVLLLPMVALATGHTTPDPPKSQPISVTSTSGSLSGAKAGARSSASSRSSSTSGAKSGSVSRSGDSQSSSRSGDSRSTSRSGDSTSSSKSGDSAASSDNQVNVASDGHVSFSSDDDTLIEDHPVVPAQFLPMILESGCRTGINAGGGGKDGSGAAGVSFMTDRCWAMTSVINFLAMGEYETACWLLVDINRDQFKRLKHSPDCTAIAARLLAADKLKNEPVRITSDPVDMSKYVTWDALQTRDKVRDNKLLEKISSK